VQKLIYDTALSMRPWRKGPFSICDTFIDSEWQSFLKYNLLLPHFNLKDKIVGDIGCNNGYYLFRMQDQNPKTLVGFDPSPLYKTQFDFINHFAKTSIIFELLGVEHLPSYEHLFDTLFCLGVLYHRSDPISTLKFLSKSLKEGGELFLDTFMIEGDEAYSLCPGKTYSKIPNVYFIPTIKALQNWGEKAGFSEMKVLDIVSTTQNEQRKTKWILGESLNDFLNPHDITKTVEGHPAPKRLYVKFLR
ncbi:MAG: tRNA 5-methoxyuridine(34)/uridine 5-oxyacetic acid(34) synthase CmoB, partial [Campylobacteraceae bacterium]|nr:tRNA 5-methoxyuridine(34)/uridine 5-oxyacetic acid(34) synthase CmoB [Campylobacteraceae bacterium]